jgi:hypothetical protein
MYFNKAWHDGAHLVIPAFGRQRQENHEFEANLGYLEGSRLA